MKKTNLAGMLLASTLQAAALPPVVNGDFELDTNGSIPSHWQGNPVFPVGSAAVTVESGQGVGGSNAAHFDASIFTVPGMDSDLIPGFVLGARYQVSFAIKGDSQGDNFFALVFDSFGSPVRGAFGPVNLPSYALGSFTFQATDTTNYLEFFLNGSSGSTASLYLDDITLTAVSPELDASAGALPLAFSVFLLGMLADRRRRKGRQAGAAPV